MNQRQASGHPGHIVNFLEENKLVASDVMYNPGLQKKFNEYMAAKGSN